ncbi:MAG: radical SAM protein [Arcobacteraceae bacterium]|nr:radical SAM protein [Arcobacteraceae bacterium]
MRALLISLLYVIKFKEKSKEHLKASIDSMLNNEKTIGLPTTITIEPANICNINCPICETGAGKLDRVKRVLKTNDFKKIIDQVYAHTNTLIYYFMGEPFLNKDWVEQVQYAKKMGINRVETSTNGDIAIAEDIISSKIDFISFQIGGMTQKTHEIYRVNSNLEKVFKNLKETINLKKEKNAHWLTIDVGFIVMKHNEHEVEEFKSFCKDIGADCFNIVIPVVRNYEEGEIYLPNNEEYWTYDKTKFIENKELIKKNKYTNQCPWMYYSTVILSNGDVVPCCEDSCGKHVLGNVLEDDFKNVWNNEKYKKFRNIVNTKQKNLELCKICSSYGISQLY